MTSTKPVIPPAVDLEDYLTWMDQLAQDTAAGYLDHEEVADRLIDTGHIRRAAEGYADAWRGASDGWEGAGR